MAIRTLVSSESWNHAMVLISIDSVVVVFSLVFTLCLNELHNHRKLQENQKSPVGDHQY